MRHLPILALSCLLAIAPMIPLQAQPVDPSKISFYRYEDDSDRFSIRLPSDWEFISNSSAVVLARAPLSSQTKTFRPNVNVIVDDLPMPYTLDALFDANVKDAQTALENFQIVEISNVTLGGISAKKLTYTCRLTYAGQVYDLKNIVYCSIYNQKFYTMTFSSLGGQFDDFQALFVVIANSWLFD